MNTTILVCYQAGTKAILNVWLESFHRHTGDEGIKVVFITANDNASQEVSEVCWGKPSGGSNVICCHQVEIPPSAVARSHGAMLDAYIDTVGIDTPYFMTMDSDCFPVADGWLKGLHNMLEDGCKIAGILHPWAPPPSDLDKQTIAWRVRSQHCWNFTHVACQLMRWEDYKILDIKYNGGDDTGLLIQKEAQKLGWKSGGYRVTRCAKPIDGSDGEFNRSVCLVFGDKIYHQGGYTRVSVHGDKKFEEGSYGWALERVLNEIGAEFLLCDENSYRFLFDKEEEVAEDKMSRLFGAKTMTGKGFDKHTRK